VTCFIVALLDSPADHAAGGQREPSTSSEEQRLFSLETRRIRAEEERMKALKPNGAPR
jgi:hypothetical protein